MNTQKKPELISNNFFESVKKYCVKNENNNIKKILSKHCLTFYEKIKYFIIEFIKKNIII